MEGVSLILVHSEYGDWSGMYVNRLLEVEGSSIAIADWEDVIQKHRVFSGLIERYEVSAKYISGIGNLPLSFDDIEKKYLINMNSF